ncbi:MAG: hypothetical protein J3R72DRAFT_181907 [Linnemannia gamsii]|nr:MAG: hypothetical protein J3R72DRAFT_181907 [Linnemannia gamsii]
MEDQDPVCLGCHRSIEEGSVVAFGEGLWHVQCFRCAKCKNRVECDSNLLLLSDGSPICEQCSYNCNSCRRPILDEAIMTGDEAYHADCFRCIQCESKIDDLVFAKTSQGIYCMKCHQERKEAKRIREERERMERAQRMMEKLLPTIPETVKRPSEPTTSHSHLNHCDISISKDFPQQPQQQQHLLQQPQSKLTQPSQPFQQHLQQQRHIHQHLNVTDTPVADQPSTSIDMPRLPFKSSRPDLPSTPTANKVTHHSHNDHRHKNGQSLPSVDVGPPFLPPLGFGLDDASTSSFDLCDMLGGSQLETPENPNRNSDPPIPPAKDVEVISSLGINSFRASVSRASLRLSLPAEVLDDIPALIETSQSSTSNHDMAILLEENVSSDHLSESIPSFSAQNNTEDDTVILEAEAMIQELRMELAKYNPLSALLHGTKQQEYGLLLEKTRKLSQEHDELEKLIRDMYIEKDMLGMDLDVMNNELK